MEELVVPEYLFCLILGQVPSLSTFDYNFSENNLSVLSVATRQLYLGFFPVLCDGFLDLAAKQMKVCDPEFSLCSIWPPQKRGGGGRGAFEQIEGPIHIHSNARLIVPVSTQSWRILKPTPQDETFALLFLLGF